MSSLASRFYLGARLLSVISFISLSTIFSSCSEDKKDDILVNNSHTKILVFDNDVLSNASFTKLGDVHSIEQVITNNSTNRIYYNQSKYWVFDRSYDESTDSRLIVCDKNGNIENVIKLPSQGPNSFKSLSDFYTDGKNVYFFDSGSNSIRSSAYPISTYTETSVPPGFYDFYLVNSRQVILDSDNSPTEISGDTNLVLFDMKSEKIIDVAVPIPLAHKGIGIQSQRFFRDAKTGQVYYLPSIGTDIYTVVDDKIRKRLNISFNSGSLPKEISSSADVGKFLDTKREQKYISYFDYLQICEPYAIIQYRHDKKFYWILMNLENGENISIRPDFPFTREYLVSYQPRLINESCEVGFLIPPFEIIDYYKNNVNKVPNTLRDIYANLLPEDNLIVMWVSLEDLYARSR